MDTYTLNRKMKRLDVSIEITSEDRALMISFYRGDDCYRVAVHAFCAGFDLSGAMKMALENAESYFKINDEGR